MSNSRMTRRQYRFDAATHAFRRPASRRLAVETLESRLLLSGTQLDYSIWNLDSIQQNYAVISQGGTLPAAELSASTPANYRAPGVTTLNVGWVVVPGLRTSPANADMLALSHFRAAISQGTFTADEIVPLYTQWRNNLGSTSGLDSAPVYAVGILNSPSTTIVGNLTDSLTDVDLVNASVGSQVGVPFRPGLGATTSYLSPVQIVRQSAEFVRRGHGRRRHLSNCLAAIQNDAVGRRTSVLIYLPMRVGGGFSTLGDSAFSDYFLADDDACLPESADCLYTTILPLAKPLNSTSTSCLARRIRRRRITNWSAPWSTRVCRTVRTATSPARRISRWRWFRPMWSSRHPAPTPRSTTWSPNYCQTT